MMTQEQKDVLWLYEAAFPGFENTATWFIQNAGRVSPAAVPKEFMGKKDVVMALVANHGYRVMDFVAEQAVLPLAKQLVAERKFWNALPDAVIDNTDALAIVLPAILERDGLERMREVGPGFSQSTAVLQSVRDRLRATGGKVDLPPDVYVRALMLVNHTPAYLYAHTNFNYSEAEHDEAVDTLLCEGTMEPFCGCVLEAYTVPTADDLYRIAEATEYLRVTRDGFDTVATALFSAVPSVRQHALFRRVAQALVRSRPAESVIGRLKEAIESQGAASAKIEAFTVKRLTEPNTDVAFWLEFMGLSTGGYNMSDNRLNVPDDDMVAALKFATPHNKLPVLPPSFFVEHQGDLVNLETLAIRYLGVQNESRLVRGEL